MENTLHRLSVWGQDPKRSGYSTQKTRLRDTEIIAEDEFSKNSTRLDSRDVWKVDSIK